MSQRLLVTGFEPFGGAALNPSQEVLPDLRAPSGWELSTLVLPVSFSRARGDLDRKIAEVDPAVVISLGQAEGRGEISLERVAINLADVSVADNDGELVRDRAIESDGPLAFYSSLPIKEMAKASQSQGVPTGISLSAGAFLCNYVFYHLQHRFSGSSVRSGFIHLPLMEEQAQDFPGKPTMSLAQMAKGLNAAFTAL